MEHKKLKSTTLWIVLCIIVLNPIAWILQFFFTRWNLEYLVNQGIDIQEAVMMIQSTFVISLPMQALATGAITAIGLYIGGNKARNISTNLSMPQGQDGRSIPPEEIK